MTSTLLEQPDYDEPRQFRVMQLQLWASVFLSGFIVTFSFAPFHFPGLAILGLALFILRLNSSPKSSFGIGFIFGLGFFGSGVSWICVSIHHYGHLNLLIAATLTFCFIAYLAIFCGLTALAYKRLAPKNHMILSAVLFGALWCCSEYCRSALFGGFPWLMLGFGQIDTPLGQLLPIIGISGVSMMTAFLGAIVASLFDIMTKPRQRIVLTGLLMCMLIPSALQNKNWVTMKTQTLSVAVVQANLSMRDKWDEKLFWHILRYYEHAIKALAPEHELIILPESSIPLPSNYVSDFLEHLDSFAKKHNSAILLGIPYPALVDDELYYNALMSIGRADGMYFKQHLVPLGEFTPSFLTRLSHWLNYPLPNMAHGIEKQAPITIHDYPIASLICYELAYPELLRQQLPQAQWIVSISDDGWFGQSLAVYQHLQMAQVFSKLSGRYQIVSNNSGLSAIINEKGQIEQSLPAFTAGTLQSLIHPCTGSTPWVLWGEMPAVLLAISVVLIASMPMRLNRRRINVHRWRYLIKAIADSRKRRYPYKLNRFLHS